MTPRDPSVLLLVCDACGFVFAARVRTGACARCTVPAVEPWPATRTLHP